MAQVPPSGLDLIKKFEGLRLEAYPDPRTGGKPYTIGWGSTRKRDGRPFQPNERITRQEADDLLIWQLEQEFLPPLTKIPGWHNLSEPQQGAILSFAYNLGAHFYGTSGFETISRVLRQQNWSNIEPALVLYRNPGSNVEEGLLRRRLEEAKTFLSGTPGVDLSSAAKTYLNSPSRTPSPGSNLSSAAKAYLGKGTDSGRRTLRLIQPYMQGSDVVEAQRALINKGAGLVADGVFGPTTAAAVKQFQQANGLAVDGVVGPNTWRKLLQRVLYLSEPYMRGDDVRQVQGALAQRGYNLVSDGIFGPGTAAAVKRFQQDSQLIADGIVGPATYRRLGLS